MKPKLEENEMTQRDIEKENLRRAIEQMEELSRHIDAMIKLRAARNEKDSEK